MLIEKLHNKALTLRQADGSYYASSGEHYRHRWVRDNVFQVLPELTRNPELYKQTMQTLLDFYIKSQKDHKKFYHLITSPDNKYPYEHIHPRFDDGLEEIPEPWGFVQLDMHGELLYGLYLGQASGIDILRGHKDSWIITLIIEYLEAIKYWELPDNGIWEEYAECHASSVGACVAGLTAIRFLGFEVPQWIIDRGYETLNRLLPRESDTKDVDLALLNLIYPFNIVAPDMAREILESVETKILRERGVIRYKGDVYYSNGKEAEWCFGLAYLSLCYSQLGEFDKARYYRDKLAEKCIVNGEDVPELFFGGTNIPNPNTPLGWSLSMTILALENKI